MFEKGKIIEVYYRMKKHANATNKLDKRAIQILTSTTEL